MTRGRVPMPAFGHELRPLPDDPLHEDDVVVVMGAEADVARLREAYG